MSHPKNAVSDSGNFAWNAIDCEIRRTHKFTQGRHLLYAGIVVSHHCIEYYTLGIELWFVGSTGSSDRDIMALSSLQLLFAITL